MELLSACIPVRLFVCLCLFLSLSIHLSPSRTNTECFKCIFMSRDSLGCSQPGEMAAETLVAFIKTWNQTRRKETYPHTAAHYFPTELSLCQPDVLEIIKVIIDTAFIRHFIPAWPWVFFIIITHDNLIHSSGLIKMCLFTFFLLFSIIYKIYTYLCVWQRPSSQLIMTGLNFTV